MKNIPEFDLSVGIEAVMAEATAENSNPVTTAFLRPNLKETKIMYEANNG